MPDWQQKQFWALIERLSEWRSDDYQDAITLCRSEIIAILDGVKAVQNRTGGPAWDTPYNRTYGPVEQRAAEIYDGIEGPSNKPPWVFGGNSLKQDACRQQARAELRAAGHGPKTVPGAPMQPAGMTNETFYKEQAEYWRAQYDELHAHIQKMRGEMAANNPVLICGACGQPWHDGMCCAQKDNGWKHEVCFPVTP
jgi:hypothetical protein